MRLLWEPPVRSLLVCNIYHGAAWALITVLPMCISSTYTDRRLIPILGGVVGVCRLVGTGLFDGMSRLLGYKVLNWVQTLLGVGWMVVVVLVFPNNSLHHVNQEDTPIMPAGEWVVYLIGILGGISYTWAGVIMTVAAGKVSRDPKTMNGFQPDAIFTIIEVIWCVSNAVIMALTPYISLYMFITLTLAGLICFSIMFEMQLLSCLRQDHWLSDTN